MINSKLKISVRFNVCNIYKNTFNKNVFFLIKLALKYKKNYVLQCIISIGYRLKYARN